MTQAHSPANPDFNNREYNNRALVPEHAAIFARWQADSAAARARLRTSTGAMLDIAYGAGPKETLDFFPARRPPPGTHASTHVRGALHAHPPILVFIHGGYWRSLDKSDFSYIAAPFVEHGVAVAVVNYELCPTVTIETITRQMLAAHTWLFLHAGQWGCDPHRIYTSGHSAGGHLAAMMLAAQWPRWHGTLPADLIKGCISISGVHDLAPMVHTPFLNADLRLKPADVPRLSPAWLPLASHAPLVTAVGADESSEFIRQCDVLANRWKANLHANLHLAARNHFTACDALGEPDHALFQKALELIQLAE